MCLIIFAHQVDPHYPFVLAANRDEFFGRSTREADFWTELEPSGQVLAGKDMQAGGTWLGITRQGRFAAVTNIRDPSQPEKKPRSRGELTLGFLTASLSGEDYCQQLLPHFDEFAGFNLLLGDGADMYYINNLEGIVERLQPGIHGLSNGLLNSDWPKIRRGREGLEASLAEGPPSTEALITLMADREQAPDPALPDTGVTRELERVLSSMFIDNADRHYGTRCSTALIRGSDGMMRFCEQNYDERGGAGQCHYFEFRL